MKRCPECRRDYYDDTLLYCLDDGSVLLEGPASVTESATVIMREPSAPDFEFNPQHSARRWKIIAAVCIVLFGIGIGLTFYTSWNKVNPPEQPLTIERVTATGNVVDASISPDGRYLAYSVGEKGQQSLWVRHLATSGGVQITPFEDVDYDGLGFTPDSNYINFARKEKPFDPSWDLYQMPVLGGAQKQMNPNLQSGVGYSPDGKHFAFTTNRGTDLRIAKSDGTGERILKALIEPEGFVGGSAPAWSPNGGILACVTANNTINGSNIQAVNVVDGSMRPITKSGWIDIIGVGWVPSGDGLFILGADRPSSVFNSQIWHVSYPDGNLTRITRDLSNYGGMSLTADSKTIAAVQETISSSIWVVPVGDVAAAEQLSSGGGNLEGIKMVAFTPDGRIVYHSLESGNHDIWIINGDGSGKKQLTTAQADNANLEGVVSPDERYVIFASLKPDGSLNIWRMNLDGGNVTQLTSGGLDASPSVSPDSRWVVYVSHSSGQSRVWRVSIDGGPAEMITDFESYRPKISPDGRFIALFFRTATDSLGTHAVIPWEGGQPVRTFTLPGLNSDFQWAHDSRSITYMDTRKGISNVWSKHLDGSAPKQLTNFKTEQIHNFGWSADGKRLLVAHGITKTDVVLIKNFR